jgi:hypothetical protein
MPARDRVRDKAQAFKGQKSSLPIESYGIDSAETIQNFYLHHGQLNKSPGCATYADVSPTATGGLLSLHVFKDILISQRATTLAAATYTTYWSDSGVFHDVLTITSAKRLFSTFWRDRLYLTNTRDVFYLPYSDGTGVSISTSVWPIGLDPPATALSLSAISNASSGNVENTDHYYMIALYDQLTNTESPCAGALPTADGIYELSPDAFLGPIPTLLAAPGSAKKVRIAAAALKTYINTAAALSGNRATHFIVYRSKPKLGTGLYDSFFRVPLKDGSIYDGNVLIPIAALGGVDPAIIPGTIGDFIDNTADASLPTVSPPENNSPPPTPSRMLASLTAAQANYGASETWTLANYSGFRHMRFFRDQLFGVGAHSYGYTVTQNISLGFDISQKVTGRITQFRDLLHGSEVYQPDYWPYRWEIGKGDAQEAIGLGVLGDVALLIFKEGSAYYLSGSSPDNFVVRIMDTQKGCVHQGTIQETSSGVITLDRSGFVLWNKIGQGERISDHIHDVVETINFQAAERFYSCYDNRLNIYRCSVAGPGAPLVNGVAVPNLTFVLDLDAMEWSLEQGGEGLARVQFFLNSNNITTISAEQAGVPSQVDVGRKYDFVASSSTGRILDYSDPTNVTNQGTAIEGIWTSGTINFGDDQHKKRMNWIYLRAKSISGWKINVEVIPDYDESRKYVLTDWDVLSSQSQWYASDIATDGSLLWDDGTGNVGGTWASSGATRQVSKIPVKCIGYTFQIRIIHKETDSARSQFAMESISAEGCLLGR